MSDPKADQKQRQKQYISGCFQNIRSFCRSFNVPNESCKAILSTTLPETKKDEEVVPKIDQILKKSLPGMGDEKDWFTKLLLRKNQDNIECIHDVRWLARQDGEFLEYTKKEFTQSNP